MDVVDLTGAVHSDDELVAWIQRGTLRGVRALAVWNAGLTDDGARALAQSADAASLVSLDLSWNHIAGPGVRALARSPHVAQLERLRLYHNDGGADAAAAVATGRWRLAALNLCGNALGDAGLAALAVHDLPALRELALGWNGLGLAGVQALIARGRPRLEQLNIRANDLDARSVQLLLSGPLPCLTRLGLDENPLGHSGLVALVSAPGFARLEWLNLGGTELDDRALDVFAARLAANPRHALRELRLQDNDIAPPVIDAIRALLACEVRA